MPQHAESSHFFFQKALRESIMPQEYELPMQV